MIGWCMGVLRSLGPRRRLCAVAAVVVGSMMVAAQSVNASDFIASRSSTSSAVATQFIAKQFTEGLGRAPTPTEWDKWIRFFSSQRPSCGARPMRVLVRAVFLGPEFARLRYRRVEALSALSRAALNRDLEAATYQRYGVKRWRWLDVVGSLLHGRAFDREASAICRAPRPAYYFDNSVRPLQTATGPGFRGSSAQLQMTLDAKARAGGGTVWLARGAVIYVEPQMPTGGVIDVPPGVRLATIGRPGPRRYEKMARLVRVGSACLTGPPCDQPVVIVEAAADRSQDGGAVQSVWVDGGGGNARTPAIAGSTVQVLSGENVAITYDRLDAPIPRDGGGATVLGLQGIGNDPSRPCSSLRALGNLVTVYSSDHFLNHRWADGITVDCEEARVERNTIVDASDAAIALFGNDGADQRSLIRNNYILSAGNDAYSALDVDPHGQCVACPDTTARHFVGSSVDHNTFISGPRTGFGFGLNLGIRPLLNFPPDGTGATAKNNSTGTGSARVNVAIAVSGMFHATLTGNTGRFVLVHINGCPLLKTAAGVTAGLASFASPPPPYVDRRIVWCWSTPKRRSSAETSSPPPH